MRACVRACACVCVHVCLGGYQSEVHVVFILPTPNLLEKGKEIVCEDGQVMELRQ